MSTYITADGVEVEAEFIDADGTAPEGADAPVWVVTYPDEVKFCHPSAFDANYTVKEG